MIAQSSLFTLVPARLVTYLTCYAATPSRFANERDQRYQWLVEVTADDCEWRLSV